MERSGAKPVTEGRTPVLNRQIKVWRSQHRDTVFSDLFSDKKWLLQLYCALHPEDGEVTEDDIANVTAKNILIRDLYNDLGFTVRGKLLLLVEAQSTWTVNVVLRMFLYLAEIWGEYIKATAQNIYSTKKVVLPATECYVVFTGDRKDKPSVISLFDEFLAPLTQSPPSLSLSADERMLDLKVSAIFASEADSRSEGCECGGESAESMDILQQYIAFSGVMRQAVCPKGADGGGTESRNRNMQETEHLA